MHAANGNDVVSELICLLVFVFMIILFVRVVLSWLQFAGDLRRRDRSRPRTTW